MYNRIELPLAPSTVIGLLAAAPWILLVLVGLGMAIRGAWLVVPVVALLALQGMRRWRQAGTLTEPDAVRQLTARGPRLFTTLANGDEEEVKVSGDSRVSGRYLVLGLLGHSSGRRYPVILLPRPLGNVPAESLRRMRVWLRLMPEHPAPIDETPWYKNFTQRIWPGGKTHDH